MPNWLAYPPREVCGGWVSPAADRAFPLGQNLDHTTYVSSSSLFGPLSVYGFLSGALLPVPQIPMLPMVPAFYRLPTEHVLLPIEHVL